MDKPLHRETMNKGVITEKALEQWLDDMFNARPATKEMIEDIVSKMYPDLEKGSKEFKEAVIRCPLSWGAM